MKLNDLITSAALHPKMSVAVAAAEDKEVIEAVILAVQKNLASFSLFGNKEKIENLLLEKGKVFLNHRAIRIIQTKDMKHSAEEAVKAIHSGRANILMKGMVPTAVLLKGVLNKQYGLRTGGILSHVAVFEIEGYDRFIFITDTAMNISPDVMQKAQIIQNAVKVARSIGLDQPKVAPIAAVEVVNPSMQPTVDAALLTQMAHRGQINDCMIDGPLGLDNAISIKAAKQKGIKSEVAGLADILLVPTIEVGNILYKSLVYFANAKVGGIIAGAKAPIVLTSRVDSAETKLYSLALGICSATR